MKKLLINLVLCVSSLVSIAQTTFTLDVVAEGNFGTPNADVFRRNTTGGVSITSGGIYQATNSSAGFDVLQDFVVRDNKAIIAEKPSGDGRVVITTYPSLAEIHTFSVSAAPEALLFVSDTKAYVSLGSPNDIRVIDLVNNTMTSVSDPSSDITTYCSYMECVSGIVYAELGSKIVKIDTVTNTVIGTIAPGIGSIKEMLYEPQGGKLWALNGSGSLVSIDIANADAVGPVIATGVSSSKLLRTYNGNLYFWSSNKNMYIYDVNTPPTLPLVSSYTSSLPGGSWSFGYGRSFDIDENTGDFVICTANTYTAPGFYEVVDGSTLTIIESSSIAGCAIPNKCILKTFPSSISTPIPDVAVLPTITSECSVTVTAPTANNGVITGTTNDPVTYASLGSYSILWTYTNGGQSVTQNQGVVINDATAPIVDVASLDTIWIDCNETITTVPTATDNCTGSISGTTSDLLVYTTSGVKTIIWSYSDNNNNSTDQDQIIVVNCTQTGVNELVESIFDIYPNPANTFITINNKNATFSGFILNSNGQKVLMIEKTNSLSRKIDISKLSNGIYFLQLIDANGDFFTEKLIVQL